MDKSGRQLEGRLAYSESGVEFCYYLQDVAAQVWLEDLGCHGAGTPPALSPYSWRGDKQSTLSQLQSPEYDCPSRSSPSQSLSNVSHVCLLNVCFGVTATDASIFKANWTEVIWGKGEREEKLQEPEAAWTSIREIRGYTEQYRNINHYYKLDSCKAWHKEAAMTHTFQQDHITQGQRWW